MPLAAQSPGIAVRSRRHSTFFYSIAAAMLAFEALPLGVLYWAEDDAGRRLPVEAEPLLLMLGAAALVALVATALGLRVAGDTAHPVPAASNWRWPGFVALLLLPTFVCAALLIAHVYPGGGIVHFRPPQGESGLHVRLWTVIFLGIANAQMVAAALLRSAAEAIPVSRFAAASLDCLTQGQRLRHVILPACAPALAMLAAVTFVGSGSEFLLIAVLRQHAAEFALGSAGSPSNLLTAVYLFGSLAMLFLGLWALRLCVRPAPFARG